MRILRSTLVAAGAATMIGLGTTGAAAADGSNATLEELNDSGAEAAVMYGGVMISVTTEGDTSGDSALAVDRFPVADADGNLEYSRTFEVSQEVADSLSNLHLVQHGIDLDGSGQYDGDAVSSLDDLLPLEATIPATCGAFGESQSAVSPGGAGAARPARRTCV